MTTLGLKVNEVCKVDAEQYAHAVILIYLQSYIPILDFLSKTKK